MPFVNYYLSQENLRHPEEKYPLRLCLCESCGLVQIDEVVPSEKMFLTYHYASSTSRPLKEHLEQLAELCRKRFRLNDRSSVLDIGCNDGTFLGALRKHEIRCLGVDPAANITQEAIARGVRVTNEFFNSSVAETIRHYEGPFDLISAMNTLAQVIDLNDFVRALKVLLRPNGVFVAEVGYVVDMVQQHGFDTIYHEHLAYFGLLPLVRLFEQNGITIFDAERIPSHGGSLRFFAQMADTGTRSTTTRLKELTKAERSLRLERLSSYEEFARFTTMFRTDFRRLITKLRKAGKRLVGLGAPAKSVILLNYCGIDDDLVDYITDSTTYKQYRFMPGVHIPVFPEERITRDHEIDCFILLAWTYKDELLRKISSHLDRGAQYIIPFPVLELV